MKNRLIVYTDGAARGNPGPSASGFEVYDHSGRGIHAHSHYNGEQTNNFAEYNAVILALKWCSENSDAKETEIALYSDSELVVRQITGKYKVKARHILPLKEGVKELSAKFGAISFHNVPREDEHIVRVDAALNRLLDSRGRGPQSINIFKG
jgi:ribonuclease HI